MSVLLHNGKIWRSGLKEDGDDRFYDWILINDSGMIEGCGGKEDIPPKAARRIDLGKKWVLPGFHDSHIHILWHGNFLADHVNLKCPNSMEEFKEKLKMFLDDPSNASSDESSWFVAYGFEQQPLGRYPTNVDLDDVSSDRPMVVYHTCLHVGVLNTAALRMVGFDENSRPQDNKIGVYPSGHEMAGRPNGLFKESALAGVMSKIPSLRERNKKAISSALNDCVRLGITSVHCLDANCWDAYVELANENKLPIQIFTDGALGSDTAALSMPYKKTDPEQEDNFGILFYSQDELTKMVKEVDECGFQLEMHVIGDKAAEFAVTALEKCGVTPDKRPILVHCQILTHELVRRMSKLGVIAAVQPQNVPLDARWVRDKLPEQLQECMYPYQTLLKNGVVCAGSSDSPAYYPNSLIGIHDVILQPDAPKGSKDKRCFQPKEKVTFRRAVDMYTCEAAKTDFAENFLGKLEVGYSANFVVLETPKENGDFVDISQKPESLLDTKVVETWARGKKIYDATE